MRDTMLADVCEHSAWIEPTQANVRAPGERYSPGVCPPVAVEHGQSPQVDAACAQPERKCIGHGVEVGAAVAVERSPWIAGGARGVIERNGLPLGLRVAAGEINIAATNESLVLHAADPLGAWLQRIFDIDHHRFARSAIECLAHERCELGVGEQHLRAPVVQYEADRGGIETSIDRVQHGARQRDCKMRLEQGRYVRCQDSNGVPGHDSRSLQG